MRFWLIPVLAAGASMMAGCGNGSNEKKAVSDEFTRFVDGYFRQRYEFHPSSGTIDGFHEYDSKLEDFSAAAILTRIASLSQESIELDAIRKKGLSPAEEIDAEFLNGQIRAELLDLETLRSFQTNPMPYVSTPGEAVDAVMKRNYAPSSDRLRYVIARLRAVPALLGAMRINVDHPPREFTELAIRIASGSVGFFRDTVRKWGEDAAAADPGQRKDLDEACRTAADAIQDATTWLRDDLLPRSTGDFAIGDDNFSRKLLYEDMVDMPLDRLLAIGEANLEKDRQAFIETARRIDPNRSPMEVMRVISSDRPSEPALIEDTKRGVESIRQFIVDRKIVAVPSEVRPIVAETPPYARAGAFAMMEMPGSYETRATEAFYYVTPPEKDLSAQQKDEYLRLFNRPVMQIITIHEVWPGHYLQFMYLRQQPSKTRKLVFSNTNLEGWAHYAEQMMVEEGFGNGDPKVKLAQLSEALLRDCRWVVGIRLHTKGMTVEQGARLFAEKGFCERAVALEEARRGTYDPTYLYYTLGKLMIYKLRDDYRQTKGSAYSLAGFHAEFLRQGGLPLKLVRRIMLPGNTGPLL
jgi:uncharacterized protein (DUF885 family)